MPTFYVLYSNTLDSYYIGATTDTLTERLRRHNSSHKKGFTGRASDWKIVYSEIYPVKADAFRREKEVKKWKSRSMIIQLIQKSIAQPVQSIPIQSEAVGGSNPE